MVKWADHVITDVRFRDDKRHILKVKITDDNGDNLINKREISRLDVVSLLENNKNIVTAYKNKQGKLDKGDKVEIILIKEVKFIRTDGNKIEADNLGELPEF